MCLLAREFSEPKLYYKKGPQYMFAIGFNRRWKLFVSGVLFAVWPMNCPTLMAQQGQADLPSGFESGRSPLLQYEMKHLLGIVVQPVEGGLRVVEILERSPVLQLQLPNAPNEQSQLEVNDILVDVAGMPVRSLAELKAALAASPDRCELRILDHRTQGIVEAIVQPKAEEHPVMLAAAGPAKGKQVHVIIAGLTDDPLLGSSIKHTQSMLESMFTGEIPTEELHMTLLTGPDCNAQKICETIQSQPVGFKDALVVYYLGHGAYDPRYAEGDPYGGHFLDIPSGDLMRRTVWDHLNAMPARFKVLVSDACNVESAADPSARIRSEKRLISKVVVGPTKLEWLFLGHSGSLDTMAASKGERAWYSPDVGGWFSKCFVDEVRLHQEWSSLSNELPARVNAYYAKRRVEFLGEPATTESIAINQLRSQESMTPVLMNRTKKDSQPPVPLNVKRTFTQEISVGVRER